MNQTAIRQISLCVLAAGLLGAGGVVALGGGPAGALASEHGARADATSTTPTTFPAVPPRMITASRLVGHGHFPGSRSRGQLVRPSILGDRVFGDGLHGFALAFFRGMTYPAMTTDGGKTWRIAGPDLWLDAAEAPLVVDQVGVLGSHTFFAFGGGYVVDVTADGGKHWWRAGVATGDAIGVVADPLLHKLIAFSQPTPNDSSGPEVPTWVYVSTDRGRHWRYDPNLGGILTGWR